MWKVFHNYEKQQGVLLNTAVPVSVMSTHSVDMGSAESGPCWQPGGEISSSSHIQYVLIVNSKVYVMKCRSRIRGGREQNMNEYVYLSLHKLDFPFPHMMLHNLVSHLPSLST